MFRSFERIDLQLFINSSKRTSPFYSFRTQRVPTIHELKGKSVVQCSSPNRSRKCIHIYITVSIMKLQRTVLQHPWLTATHWKKQRKQSACIACEETRLPRPRVAPPGRPGASRANPSPRTLCPLSLSDKQTEWQFETKHHKATRRQSWLVACHCTSLHTGIPFCTASDCCISVLWHTMDRN